MPKIQNSHINPLGFREYDARWLYPKDINPDMTRAALDTYRSK